MYICLCCTASAFHFLKVMTSNWTKSKLLGFLSQSSKVFVGCSWRRAGSTGDESCLLNLWGSSFDASHSNLGFFFKRFFYEAKVGKGDFKLKLKDSTGNAQSHCKDMAIGKALETKPKLGQLIEEVNPKCFKASSCLMQNDSLALVAKNEMLLPKVSSIWHIIYANNFHLQDSPIKMRRCWLRQRHRSLLIYMP